jgi:hypothetical protein
MGTTLVVIVMAAVAILFTPLRLALTVNVTIPAVDPAVNVMVRPLEGLTEPRVLFNDHAYVMPEDGQEPGEHAGVAANPSAPPVRTVTDVMLRVTPVRIGVTAVLMVMAAESVAILPLRVAVTVKVTGPELDPAVNVMVEPVVELTLPRVLFSVHAYEMPEGQVAVHVGVAAKSCVPPGATVGAVGLTVTEERVIGLTVSVAVAIVECLAESLTKTLTVKAPVVVGVQDRE